MKYVENYVRNSQALVFFFTLQNKICIFSSEEYSSLLLKKSTYSLTFALLLPPMLQWISLLPRLLIPLSLEFSEPCNQYLYARSDDYVTTQPWTSATTFECLYIYPHYGPHFNRMRCLLERTVCQMCCLSKPFVVQSRMERMFVWRKIHHHTRICYKQISYKLI